MEESSSGAVPVKVSFADFPFATGAGRDDGPEPEPQPEPEPEPLISPIHSMSRPVSSERVLKPQIPKGPKPGQMKSRMRSGVLKEIAKPKQYSAVAAVSVSLPTDGTYEVVRCPGMSASWSANNGLWPGGRLVVACPPMLDGPLQNPEEIAGNVVLIQRGAVSFGDKARQVVEAGATGIVFVNDTSELVGPMSHHKSLAIPAVCIDRRTGGRIMDRVASIPTEANAGAYARWTVLTFAPEFGGQDSTARVVTPADRSRRPYTPRKVAASISIQAIVRGWQARARTKVVQALLSSVQISVPVGGEHKVVRYAGMNANWCGDAGLAPGAKLVLAEPLLANRPLTNHAEISGNVALIERGAVSFGDKAQAAVEAGAIGVIFLNTEFELLAPVSDKPLTIPAVCIGVKDASSLLEMLQNIPADETKVPVARWAVMKRIADSIIARKLQTKFRERRAASPAALEPEPEPEPEMSESDKKLEELRLEEEARQRFEREQQELEERKQAAIEQENLAKLAALKAEHERTEAEAAAFAAEEAKAVRAKEVAELRAQKLKAVKQIAVFNAGKAARERKQEEDRRYFEQERDKFLRNQKKRRIALAKMKEDKEAMAKEAARLAENEKALAEKLAQEQMDADKAEAGATAKAEEERLALEKAVELEDKATAEAAKKKALAENERAAADAQYKAHVAATREAAGEYRKMIEQHGQDETKKAELEAAEKARLARAEKELKRLEIDAVNRTKAHAEAERLHMEKQEAHEEAVRAATEEAEKRAAEEKRRAEESVARQAARLEEQQLLAKRLKETAKAAEEAAAKEADERRRQAELAALIAKQQEEEQIRQEEEAKREAEMLAELQFAEAFARGKEEEAMKRQVERERLVAARAMKAREAIKAEKKCQAQARIQKLRKQHMVSKQAKGLMTEIRLEAERRERQRIKEEKERERKRLEALKLRRKLLWKESQNVLAATRMQKMAAEEALRKQKEEEKARRKAARRERQRKQNERLARQKKSQAEADKFRNGPDNEEKKIRKMELVKRLQEAESRLEASKIEYKIKLAAKLEQNEDRRQAGKEQAAKEHRALQEAKANLFANKTRREEEAQAKCEARRKVANESARLEREMKKMRLNEARQKMILDRQAKTHRWIQEMERTGSAPSMLVARMSVGTPRAYSARIELKPMTASSMGPIKPFTPRTPGISAQSPRTLRPLSHRGVVSRGTTAGSIAMISRGSMGSANTKSGFERWPGHRAEMTAQVIALHQAPRDELATMRKRINQELDEISRSAALHEEESDAELAHVAESLASSWGPRAATNMLANTNIDPQPRREWWEVLMGSDPRKSGRNSRSPSPGLDRPGSQGRERAFVRTEASIEFEEHLRSQIRTPGTTTSRAALRGYEEM